MYRGIATRYADAPEPAVQAAVTVSLFGVGVIHWQRDRFQDVLAAFDEVAAYCADAADPALRDAAAKSLFARGAELG